MRQVLYIESKLIYDSRTNFSFHPVQTRARVRSSVESGHLFWAIGAKQRSSANGILGYVIILSRLPFRMNQSAKIQRQCPVIDDCCTKDEGGRGLCVLARFSVAIVTHRGEVSRHVLL